MTDKRTLLVVGAALALVLLLSSSAKASTPPPVVGTVTSGSQSTQIDTNVLSPTFGLPILTG